MKAIDYLMSVVDNGAAYVPTDLAEAVEHALYVLGYRVCAGALDWSNCNIVLYIA